MLDRIFKKKILSSYISLLSVLSFFLLLAETVSQYISCYSDLWFGLDGLEFESQQRAIFIFP
jgi:hypothetical protein